MLLHIYKNLFTQMLRRAGYSKKQAKVIYARFLVELEREEYMERSIENVARQGMTASLVMSGFIWLDTKQGLKYWFNVYNTLRKKGALIC